MHLFAVQYIVIVISLQERGIQTADQMKSWEFFFFISDDKDNL
jgi:hypothetical protein